MPEDYHGEVELSDILVDRISEILSGQPRLVQGLVVAELLATWLAGHCIPGNLAQTKKIRELLLREHLDYVDHLMNLAAKRIGTPYEEPVLDG
jgi:hypothetical protein